MVKIEKQTNKIVDATTYKTTLFKMKNSDNDGEKRITNKREKNVQLVKNETFWERCGQGHGA